MPGPRAVLAAALAALVASGPAAAQPVAGPDAAEGPGLNAAAVRVLDQQRLFTGSRLGQGLLAELRAAEQALERDNAALAEQLQAEERELTELRASLDPDEFRARADAFDRRVEAIRAERARLAQDLARRYEAEARRFFEIALPVLSELMAEQGVAVLLNPEAVILAPDWLDITPAAIDRLDRAVPARPEP